MTDLITFLLMGFWTLVVFRIFGRHTDVWLNNVDHEARQRAHDELADLGESEAADLALHD